MAITNIQCKIFYSAICAETQMIGEFVKIFSEKTFKKILWNETKRITLHSQKQNNKPLERWVSG